MATNQAAATLFVEADPGFLIESLRRTMSKAETVISGKGIKFNIDESSARLPLGRITGDVKQFNDSLATAAQRVVAFTAAASVIGAGAKGLQEIFKATIQVQDAFKQINSVFNLSSDGLAKFSSNLFSVARNTGTAFDVAGKAALEFSRQGLSAEETLKRVSAALTLTRLSGLDAGKAVEAITTGINGFSKEGITATDIVNKFVAADSKFAVSSGDLAEAISRVGSSAQDVGVSFDKLVGIVTSARQITGRDGATIGNALRSIFTRIEKTETLDQLESLGVKVRDLRGNALDADVVLSNLAKVFDTLTAAQKENVTQLSAGLFQANQFKAIIGDLGKSFSIYKQATEASSVATTEAAKRNEALNSSLKSILQNTKTTATEIGATLGNLSFADPLKKALDILNSNFITEGLKKINVEDSAKSLSDKFVGFLASGISKGIGNILTGPGAIIGGALALKAGSTILGKVTGGVQSVLGNDNTKDVATQEGINKLLAVATEQETARFKAAQSVAAQETIILEILQKQIALGAARAGAASSLVSQVQSGSAAKIISGLGRGASGFIPHYVDQEASDVKKGTGGARKDAKPVVIKDFNFGGGKKGTMVANTDEYLVHNFKGSGGTAVFNQDMVKKLGLPKDAIKVASNGYTPNYADYHPIFNPFKGSPLDFLKEVGPEYEKRFQDLLKEDPELGDFILNSLDKGSPDAVREISQFGSKIAGKKAVLITPAKYGLSSSSYLDLDKSPSEIKARLKQSFDNNKIDFPFKAADGFTPNYAAGDFLSRGEYLGRGMFGQVNRVKGREDIAFKKFLGNVGDTDSQIEQEFTISRMAEELGLPVSKVYGTLDRSKKREGIAKEAINGLTGAQFEDAFGITSRDIQTDLKNKFGDNGINPFDLKADGFIIQDTEENLRKVLQTEGKAGLIELAKKKAVVVDPGLFFPLNKKASQLYDTIRGNKAAADGFAPNQKDLSAGVPNYAKKALNDAWKREQSAGVNSKDIYVDQDNRIKSPKNPFGYLIANKRDEPISGKQGVDRYLNKGQDPKMAGAASGFVPSFADNDRFDIRKASGNLISTTQVGEINDLIGVYKQAISSGNKAYQKYVQDELKQLDLSSRSLADIRAYLEDTAKAILSEKRANEKIAAEATRRADAQTTVVTTLGGSKKIINSPEQYDPIAQGKASLQPSQTVDEANAARREELKAIQVETKKIQEETAQRETFLRSRTVESRGKALENISNRVKGGGLESITSQQDQFLSAQLGVEGIKKGQETLGPGANKDAIEAFAKNYVATKRKELDDSFTNTLARVLNTPTAPEAALNKPLYSLSNKQIESVSGKSGPDRAENIFNTRPDLSNIGTDRNKIGSLVNFGKSGTLETDFENNTKKLITAGSSLEDAYVQASQTLLKSGGNAKQLETAQIKYLDSLILYSTELQSAAKQEVEIVVQKQASAKRTAQLQADYDSLLKTNLINTPAKKAEQIIAQRGLTGDDAKTFRDQAQNVRQGQLQRASSIGLSASFIAPLIAGFIPEGRGGTTGGQIAGGASGLLNGAGSGAALGSFFGPLGTLVGAGAGGILGGFIGQLNKATKSFEELSKEIEDVNAKNAQQVNALSNYIQIQEQINQTIQSGGSDKQINSLLKQQGADLKTVNPTDRRDILNSGSDIEKLVEVLRSITDRAQQTARVGDATSAVFSAKSNAGFFSDVKTKDIENAAQALNLAIDTSKKSVSDSLEGFAKAIPGDPIKAFKDFGQGLGFNADQINDITDKYKDSSDVLKQIFTRLLETEADAKKLDGASAERQARQKNNIDFSRNLRQAGIQTVFNADQIQKTGESANRLTTARAGAASQDQDLDIVSRARQETSLSIQNVLREVNIQLQAGAEKAKGTLFTSISSNSKEINGLNPGLFEKLTQAKTPEDFKGLVDSIGKGNQDLKDQFIKAYQELVGIRQNAQIQVQEIKELGRIQTLQASLEQRNRVLSGSRFSEQGADNFSNLINQGRTRNTIGRRPETSQSTALLGQIDVLDQGGLPQTNNTARFRDSLKGSLAKTDFAEKLSAILNEEVYASEEEIKRAVGKVLDKPNNSRQDVVNKDTANRISLGLDSLQNTPDKIIQQIQGGKTSDISSLVSAGKISNGEGGLITQFSKLSDVLIGGNGFAGLNDKLGSNGPIASLLAQIKENQSLNGKFQENDKLRGQAPALQRSISNQEDRIRKTQLTSAGGFTDKGIKNIFPVNTHLEGGNSGNAFDTPSSVFNSSIDKLNQDIRSFLQEQKDQGVKFSEAIDKLINGTEGGALRTRNDITPENLRKQVNNSLDNSITDPRALQSLGQMIKALGDTTRELAELNNKIAQDNTPDGLKRRRETTAGLAGPEKTPFISSLSATLPNGVNDITKYADNYIKQTAGQTTAAKRNNTENLSTQSDIGKKSSDDRTTIETARLDLTTKLAQAQRDLARSTPNNTPYEARIQLLEKTIDLQTQLDRLSDKPLFSTLADGFKGQIAKMEESVKDFSTIGAGIADSLQSRLGNSFGDFVTGAKKGKAAFSEFVLGILNDASRAFASKAVQQLIGAAFGGSSGTGGIFGASNGGAVPKLNKGGTVPKAQVKNFAVGGQVPAMLTGGEYYLTPEQVNNIGSDNVKKINDGSMAKFADGGLVQGGSGTKDDVVAHLDSGGYVIKKSSVNKYGADYIGSLADNTVQKRFVGGGIFGALIGAAIGYATAPKGKRTQNALIGAGAGFITGGLAQNYAQTGSAFSSGDNSGFFSFANQNTVGSGGYTPNQSIKNGNYKVDSTPATATSPATNSGGGGIKQAAISAGLAGVLGLASSALTPKTDSTSSTGYTGPNDPTPIPGKFAYLAQKSDGGTYVQAYGDAPATRRFAQGGPVQGGLVSGGSGLKDDIFSKLAKGGAVIKPSSVQKYGVSWIDKLVQSSVKSNMASLSINDGQKPEQYAEGGVVGGYNPSTIPTSVNSDAPHSNAQITEPKVTVSITINNNGDVTSSSKSEGGDKDKNGGGFGADFGLKLEKQVRGIVKDEILQSNRVGAQTSQIARAR